MNNVFKKIGIAIGSFALAVGVGVVLSRGDSYKEAKADPVTHNIFNGASGWTTLLGKSLW